MCYTLLVRRQVRALGVSGGRLESAGGQRFLLKSIHYAAMHRADMFTLPCKPQVSFPAPAPARRVAAG